MPAIFSKVALKTKTDRRYERKRYLLTIPEKHFFNVLSEIMPEDIYICPQACFGGVLNVTAPTREYMFHYFVDEACASAGLIILHFRVRKNYDHEEIVRILEPTTYEARIWH